MSDTTENPVPTEDNGTPEPPAQKGTTLTDVEALQAELNKARQEAAQSRAKNNELKTAAEKWAEFEESQKSELQKAQELNESLQRQAQAAQLEAAKTATALRYGLPADDLDLLGTGDEATIAARAQRLADLHKAATHTPPPSQQPRENLASGTGNTPPAADQVSYPSSWRI